MRPLFTFNGGVHPPQHKDESTRTPIERAPLPPRLDVPLHQSVGNAAKACVKVGERVLKGQRIGDAEGNLSAAVHAPTSGTVVAIGEKIVAHPSGLPDICVTIETDGLDEAIAPTRIDLDAASPNEIRQYLRDMGVVGLGGAVFPSHLKLAGSKDVALETLILNGAECEPYITCDDLLMRERASEIVAGAELMYRLMQPKDVLIGIEDNKPQAIDAMRDAVARSGVPIQVIVVPTVYPSGGAKQLIRILTGKEVPTGVRSTDLGVQCFNVATAYTIYRALIHAEPVISRVVTLTGNVERAGNLEALLGTSVEFLLRHAGVKHGTDRVIMGGPMMGIALPTVEAGITKAANCLIAGSTELFPPKGPALPCIRCGKCAEACPADLQPQDLYWFAKAKQFGKAQEWALFDCIECGCCAYVCPSEIPLVDYYRFAKTEIWAAEREKKAANHARERHEFRLFRIEREKEEKAARLAAKAASAKPSTSAGDLPKAPAGDPSKTPAAAATDDEKQAKIKAAMERAAAKRAEAAPKNVEPANADVAAKMAEQDRLAEQIAAERKAVGAHPVDAGAADATAADAAADEKRAKIMEAMAKAAARKAAREAAEAGGGGAPADSASPTDPSESPGPNTAGAGTTEGADDEKKAKILEAMAKAAARKAAKEAAARRDETPAAMESTPASAIGPDGADARSSAAAPPHDTAGESPVSSAAADDEKRARIIEAMAKAAARKAAKEGGTAGPGTAGPGTASSDTASPDTAGPGTADTPSSQAANPNPAADAADSKAADSALADDAAAQKRAAILAAMEKAAARKAAKAAAGEAAAPSPPLAQAHSDASTELQQQADQAAEKGESA